MTDKTPLKPPDGYKTWIDYAIATMDVRTPHLESCDTDTVILSDDFRQAAQDEYDDLVTALEDSFIKPSDELCIYPCDKCIPFDIDNEDSCGLYLQCSTLARAKG